MSLLAFLSVGCELGDDSLEPPQMQEFEALRHDDLSIALLCAKTASLADKEWIAFEIRNSGEEVVEISDASYQIEAEIWVDGKRHMIRDLASGNSHAVFSYSWKNNRSIHAAGYTVARHPSRTSSASLHFPKFQEFEVKASFHIRLTLKDDTRLSTPKQGVPFSFRWRQPDAEGLASIEEELLDMLENPQDDHSTAHHSRLAALFKAGPFPSLTPERLVRSIDLRRDGTWGGRREIIHYYINTLEDLSALQDYYRDQIRDGSRSLFADIWKNALWRDDFLVPLVTVATNENAPQERWEALQLLFRFWTQWFENEEIRSDLAKSTTEIWRRIYGKTQEDIVKSDEIGALADFIAALGKCRDPNSIPMLRPYLEWTARHVVEDKIAWWPNLNGTFTFAGTDNFTLPPTFRIRDEALYAILTIQYGDPKKGLIELGFRELVPQTYDSTWHIEEEDQWREAIIQKVMDATK